MQQADHCPKVLTLRASGIVRLRCASVWMWSCVCGAVKGQSESDRRVLDRYVAVCLYVMHMYLRYYFDRLELALCVSDSHCLLGCMDMCGVHEVCGNTDAHSRHAEVWHVDLLCEGL